MRIAFISWEFPPETGGGGIGTYLQQASRMLIDAGHEVWIFAGGKSFQTESTGRFHLIRVKCPDRTEFRSVVPPSFAQAHQESPFDVIEGPDFGADALEIRKNHPEIPYLCKLHTPSVWIDRLHYHPPSFAQRFRMQLGSLKEGRILSLKPPTLEGHPDIEAITQADHIASPTHFMKEWATTHTPVTDDSQISVFPLPYKANNDYLNTPPSPPGPLRILFLGRLEERKGVIDCIDAFKNMLPHFPEAQLVLVGRSMPAPDQKTDMADFLVNRLGGASERVSFLGALPPQKIIEQYALSHICVFPSHWESFGLVCCEAMAAGRPLIVCQESGMAEVAGPAALNVPFKSPQNLADAMIKLAQDEKLRHELGEIGRRRIQDIMSFETIMPLQLEAYRKAIRSNAESSSKIDDRT